MSSVTCCIRTASFRFLPGRVRLWGTVVNPATGAAVGGAVVTVHSAKSPSGNAYVVNYCTDAGVCTASPSGTYSNGKFVVYDVDAGEAIVVRATKNGWHFNDRSIVTFADAITSMIIYSSMAITGPTVENRHSADGNYYTYLDITIDSSFTGTLPDGISELTVTGPGGNVIATKANFTYDLGVPVLYMPAARPAGPG